MSKSRRDGQPMAPDPHFPNALVREVIEVEYLTGEGVQRNPSRRVRTYFAPDGQPLATIDLWLQGYTAAYVQELELAIEERTEAIASLLLRAKAGQPGAAEALEQLVSDVSEQLDILRAAVPG